MIQSTRRKFLADVGRGMLVASVGSAAASELGLSPAGAALAAAEGADRLTFGSIEPLVGLMQETPAAKLLPVLVERLQSGSTLRELVAAAALANARTFGGEDYIGFHTMMALSPAYSMAMELPEAERPLPVMKVLFRNTNRIQEAGGAKNEVLRPVEPGTLPEGRPGGEALREAVRRQDIDSAERTFARLAQGPADEAFNHLLIAVEDHTEVHRVVLPYRAWDLLGLVGKEHAHTLLRQSVRYCVRNEKHSKGGAREVLAKVLEQHRLLDRTPGSRAADDRWVEEMSKTIFGATPEGAAEAAGAALAEGMAPEALAEAISLVANQLVLRDRGRPARHASAQKPEGSVHGDSIGVHASDAVNAWRNIARAANPRNVMASLVLAAYEAATGRAARYSDFDFLKCEPRPWPEDLEKVKATDPEGLLRELDGAILEKDQGRACAVVHRYGGLGFPSRPVFDLLLRYGVSEDGALHAEKYYRTVSDEFAGTRPAFRWRQLVALARVTASEYGLRAPGYEEARRLLVS